MTRRTHAVLTPAPDELTPGELFELEAWALSKPEHAWAAPHVGELAEACLDHFRAVGEHRADWMATIRTWIRRTPQYQRPAPRAPAMGGRPFASFAEQRSDATKEAARDSLVELAERRKLRRPF